jgi:hypothetical protein
MNPRGNPPLNAREFKQIVSECEKSFGMCLEALLALKSGDLVAEGRQRDFQAFQSRLYGSLLKLSRGYHRLRVSRDDLIARKTKLSRLWFTRRQRIAATTLRRFVVGCGRAISSRGSLCVVLRTGVG